MMEGDYKIKDWDYDVGEVNVINWGNILKHNKDKTYRYFHVRSFHDQLTPLQYYDKDINLYALLCDIRLPNSIIELSQQSRPFCAIIQWGSIADLDHYVSVKDEFAKTSHWLW